MLSKNIQRFLDLKLSKNTLSRKDLVKLSGVSYSVITSLLSAGKPNPNIGTIVKLADTFNVKIDDLLNGHDTLSVNNYIQLTPDTLAINLRSFLTTKINKDNISLSKLSILCGMSSAAIAEFTMFPYKKNSLGCASLLKISHYLDISIDEMIGRVAHTKEKQITTPKKQSICGITNKIDLDRIQKIKASMASFVIKTHSSDTDSGFKSPTHVNTKHKKDDVPSR